MKPWYYYIEIVLYVIIGVWMFMLSYGIHLPPIKNDDVRKKFDEWVLKYGKVMRISSIVLIVIGLVQIFFLPGVFMHSSVNKEMTEWTDKNKQLFVNNCIESAVTMKKKYPEMTHQYCECALQKIMDSMNYEEYVSTLNKTKEEQMQLMMPTVEDCLSEFSYKRDSIKGYRYE